MAFLALDNLTKHFGSHVAVDRLSLEVEKGEFVSLLGPSGCGKTTTLQMIAGFVEPSGGAIRLEGRDLLAVKPAQARPRHRVPELRAVPAYDGGGERGVRPRDAGRRGGRAHQARRRDAGAGRPRGLRGALPAPALGRPAAARGAGPRAGDPAADPAARRAAVEPRRQAARGDADRIAPDPAQRRHDHDPGDARPGRGDGARRTASS